MAIWSKALSSVGGFFEDVPVPKSLRTSRFAFLFQLSMPFRLFVAIYVTVQGVLGAHMPTVVTRTCEDGAEAGHGIGISQPFTLTEEQEQTRRSTLQFPNPHLPVQCRISLRSRYLAERLRTVIPLI